MQILYDASGVCCGSQIVPRASSDVFGGSHRTLVECAFATDARGFILVHNHPSGMTQPSVADVRATRAIAAVARAVGLELADHWIVTRSGAASLRRLGLIPAPASERQPTKQGESMASHHDPNSKRAVDAAIHDLAAAARRSSQRRAAVLGVQIDGAAWDLLVEAFLARFRRARDPLPVIPQAGAVLEALDPVVGAGLAVVVPGAAGRATLELSEEGQRRVRRFFSTMAREEAQAAMLHAAARAD